VSKHTDFHAETSAGLERLSARSLTAVSVENPDSHAPRTDPVPPSIRIVPEFDKISVI